MCSRLREICTLLHISQAELVRRSGVSEQTIRELLRGEHPPSLPVARKVAAAVGAGSVDAVFPAEEERAA